MATRDGGNQRNRKQFINEDRALQLATAIATAEEQRSQARAQKSRAQVTRMSSKESKVGVTKLSKSRLKETMAILEARSKEKKRRRREKVADDIKTKEIAKQTTRKKVTFA